MVAYSFQKRFIEPIQAGTKVHTIRANGKRRHVRPDEMIQLYFGMRTEHCRKIITDQTCSWVVPITMIVGASSFNKVEVWGLEMDATTLDDFAITDGFKNAADMHDFWLKMHGECVFKGQLIGWGDGKTQALAA